MAEGETVSGNMRSSTAAQSKSQHRAKGDRWCSHVSLFPVKQAPGTGGWMKEQVVGRYQLKEMVVVLNSNVLKDWFLSLNSSTHRIHILRMC